MKIKGCISFVLLFFALNLFSQSDEVLIRHSLHNYFNGTSFNHLDQIRSAFYEEATLYLENREGELMKLSPEEYIAFFKKEAGTFSGRYNEIISIDVFGNLAQVKAEITVPSIKRVYTDVFIFRKMEEGLWQIVSKAANSRDMEE